MVFGLVVLAALVAGLAWLVFTTVTRAPAVVAAIVTGFAALVGLGVQRHLERERDDERERRKRMEPVYEQLIRQFYKGAGGGEITEGELLDFMNELAQRLLIWGSELVIAAFIEWRATLTAQPEGSADNLFAFENLIYAMREDLGNERKKLGKGDLLRVFINDIDDFLVPDEIELRDQRAPSGVPRS